MQATILHSSFGGLRLSDTSNLAPKCDASERTRSEVREENRSIGVIDRAKDGFELSGVAREALARNHYETFSQGTFGDICVPHEPWPAQGSRRAPARGSSEKQEAGSLRCAKLDWR